MRNLVCSLVAALLVTPLLAQQDKPAPVQPAPTAPLKMDAVQLWRAYRADVDKAAEKYNGKLIEVRGEILVADPAEKDRPAMVYFRSEPVRSEFLTPAQYGERLTQKALDIPHGIAAKLAPGQKLPKEDDIVIVRGVLKTQPFDSWLTLSDAVIVPVPQPNAPKRP